MSLTFQKQPRRGVKKYLLIILLPFLVLLLSYAVYKIFLVAPPEIKGLEGFEFLPAKKRVIIKGRNLNKIEIHIIQASRDVELLKDTPAKPQVEYQLDINPKDLGLRDGAAIVTVHARSSIIKKFHKEIKATVDTVAPRLQILKAPSILRRGESGRALLKAVDADSVYITYGTMQFKAYETNKNTYIALFPVPYEDGKGKVFYAVAKDRAGNTTTRSLHTRIKAGTFRRSTLNISDAFIQRVVFPLLNISEADDPVEAFRKINEDWRRRDTERVKKIGQNSLGERLWRGRFLQLKNSKVMARYGDFRIYRYKGRAISKSVHLGFDLASTTFAPVEAANSGEVRFAGDLGIYGNTIIIDHGQGLMSLYGHLSEILVKEGQRVKKGELIARTGSTGFAGGDHLHFGILVQGVAVSPLYWWDARWIRNNVL
ncbi:MAG TPA: M23 family metallopeptidase [Nitrospirae bacterium]|nr:M23 family metallopeptidase [Nitrospirota bacterium]